MLSAALEMATMHLRRMSQHRVKCEKDGDGRGEWLSN